MSAKNFLRLVAFALAFSLSLSVVFVSKLVLGLSIGEKITNVLTEDINNGWKLREGVGRGIVYQAAITEEYVTASESINVSGLPSDFQAAWKEHMQAWRANADYLDAVKYSPEFARDRDGTSAMHCREITETWIEVLRVAQKHGATIPKNAYD